MQPFAIVSGEQARQARIRSHQLETFGSPHSHWVHVTVDANDPNVFTFRERIVRANVAVPK